MDMPNSKIGYFGLRRCTYYNGLSFKGSIWAEASKMKQGQSQKKCLKA